MQQGSDGGIPCWSSRTTHPSGAATFALTWAQSRAYARMAPSTRSPSSLLASRSALSITSTKGRPAGAGRQPGPQGPCCWWCVRSRYDQPAAAGQGPRSCMNHAGCRVATCPTHTHSSPVCWRNSRAASRSASADCRTEASGCLLPRGHTCKEGAAQPFLRAPGFYGCHTRLASPSSSPSSSPGVMPPFPTRLAPHVSPPSRTQVTCVGPRTACPA